MTLFHNYVDHLLIFDYSLTAVSLLSCKTSYFPFGITIDQTNNNAHRIGILSLFTTLLYFNMQLMCIICIFFSEKKYKVWQQNCNREENVCALKFVDSVKSVTFGIFKILQNRAMSVVQGLWLKSIM